MDPFILLNLLFFTMLLMAVVHLPEGPRRDHLVLFVLSMIAFTLIGNFLMGIIRRANLPFPW